MNEDFIKIEITSSSINGKIYECRRKLDLAISTLKRPPRNSNIVQDIELKKVVGNILTYRIFWRPQIINNEAKYL